MDNLEKTLDDANIQMDQDVSQNFYNNWQAVPPTPTPNPELYL
jgi:hypothetical protein